MKKAQSEIITTVLIILLVLAAIVIVWQVVQSTIKGGANQITDEASCIGVVMSVTKDPTDTTNTKFIVRREAGGDVFPATTTSVVVLVDGVTTSAYASFTNSGNFYNPLTSGVLTLNSAATTSVEAALKVGDTVCPITGKVTI